MTENPDDFVPVTFVDDMEEAREYETLLKTHDIPVKIVKQEAEPRFGPKDPSDEQKGKIAVMVHEDFLDEAFTIIESHDDEDFRFGLEDD